MNKEEIRIWLNAYESLIEEGCNCRACLTQRYAKFLLSELDEEGKKIEKLRKGIKQTIKLLEPPDKIELDEANDKLQKLLEET